MRGVNFARLQDLLSTIAESKSRLRELGNNPLDVFLADYRNTESAKYLFIVVTEAAIDICSHLVARGGSRAPDNYADCFSVLADQGIIASDLVPHLKNMARFQNLIVHLYWKVDNEQVYEIIHTNLSDLDTFQSQVSQWLTTNTN